jgi:hypothetical protein
MNSRDLVTVGVSAAVSVALSLVLDSYRHPKQELIVTQAKNDTRTLRGKKIELVDDKGAVRSAFEMTGVEGHEQPQFTMKDERGRTAVVLTLNEWGQGFIAFNSDTKQGKVMVGYIETGDTPTYNDSTGSWGLRILGMDGKDVGVGILNSGKVLVPQPTSK